MERLSPVLAPAIHPGILLDQESKGRKALKTHVET